MQNTNADYFCARTQLFENSSFTFIFKFHYFFKQISYYMSMQTTQYTRLFFYFSPHISYNYHYLYHGHRSRSHRCQH